MVLGSRVAAGVCLSVCTCYRNTHIKNGHTCSFEQAVLTTVTISVYAHIYTFVHVSLEQVVFKRITTGASDDLDRVTKMAYSQVVCVYIDTCFVSV